MPSVSTLPTARPLGPVRPLEPIMTVLKGYLDLVSPDALDKAVKAAHEKLPKLMDDFEIQTAQGFLDYANELLVWIPHEDFKGKDIYNVICIFYFVLDQLPLGSMQTPIDPSSANKPLTWLSAWIVAYVQIMGQFMDTPQSLTADSLQTFKDCAPYCYDDCIEPEGGFRTFNEFFARQLKPGMRPIAGPNDPLTIVYPADSCFSEAYDIDQFDMVNVKDIEWRIEDLLADSDNHAEFQNGVWMHAFLNTYNYHRQHAPVSGKVVEAKVIQGAAYLDVAVADDLLVPSRSMPGPDAQDASGYQFLQTRGLIVLDSPELGLVAVLPIGMAHVSSVILSVKEGDTVKKGQELSYFQFGGSDCVVVFQEKAGLKSTDFMRTPPDKGYSEYGSPLATANPKTKTLF
ncbi:phosphatidylserine decarboxylase-like protein [Bombardia bombarda]|uniref:Phosphatidylserine decarboxylase-like protein n=1 Tax=Bombardia bombarda TaxID=252184 RepID=A0AA39WA63_9PEZI|nr:phosphatidylserine decarboxylase-like protein [Bombardia bombarda]